MKVTIMVKQWQYPTWKHFSITISVEDKICHLFVVDMVWMKEKKIKNRLRIINFTPLFFRKKKYYTPVKCQLFNP